MPLPAQEACAALIQRIGVPGRIAEVTEDTYGWFLECLPPKYQGADGFAFAEGAEPLRYFWTSAGRYFCRQLTWDETQTFCHLARMALPW